VILAGVLLKMGGYGFVRFSLPMFPEASAQFIPLMFVLSGLRWSTPRSSLWFSAT
jgi:NADH-quinone oxidoreductase subunit M